MSTITIKQPEPGDELVRLLNSGRSDELNVEGKSYRTHAAPSTYRAGTSRQSC